MQAAHGESLIADASRCSTGGAGSAVAQDINVPAQAAFWFFVIQDALELHVARTLALISSNQAIRERALDDARSPGKSYLESCLRESLRLWTPVPLLLRRQLTGGAGPASGDVLLIDAAGYHRSRLFKDPDRFDPDGPNPACADAIYFSHGGRACAGQHLAVPLIVHTLAALLRRFNFELVEPGIDIDDVPPLFNHFAVNFSVTER
jgi:cytochrome P450